MIHYNKRTNNFNKLGFNKVTETLMERLNKRKSDVNKKVLDGIAVHTYFEVFINSKTKELTIYCDKRIHNYVLAGVLKFFKDYKFISYEVILERTPEEPEPIKDAAPAVAPEPLKVDLIHINLGKWDNYPTGAPERLDGVEIVLQALRGAKRVQIRFEYEGHTRHHMAALHFISLLREMGYTKIDYKLDFDYIFELSGSPDRAAVSYTTAVERVRSYGRSYPGYGGEVVLFAKYEKNSVYLRIIVQSDTREYRELENDFYPVPNREFPLEPIKRENADTLIQVMAAHLSEVADGLFYRFYLHRID